MDGKLPEHVAIIMDGNGRWAEAQGKPRFRGHQTGRDAAREIIRVSKHFGVKNLTLFGFGLENLRRPSLEVKFIVNLIKLSLRLFIREMQEEGVRFRVIGDRSQMPKGLLNRIERCEKITENNTAYNLNVALYYSGRWDIVQASRRLTAEVVAGRRDIASIDEHSFQQYLALADSPEPDLLIRTSGEQRISNFLLWQFAYTELYFPKIYWPDFTVEEYKKALQAFASRDRRFGHTQQQIEAGQAEVQNVKT